MAEKSRGHTSNINRRMPLRKTLLISLFLFHFTGQCFFPKAEAFFQFQPETADKRIEDKVEERGGDDEVQTAAAESGTAAGNVIIPPDQKRDSRESSTVEFSSCYSKFAIGKQLVATSSNHRHQTESDEECREKCNIKSPPAAPFTCTFYSFGFLEDADATGICILTDQKRSELNTSNDSRFDIYERTNHCSPDSPESRILTGKKSGRSYQKKKTIFGDGGFGLEIDPLAVNGLVVASLEAALALPQTSSTGVCFRLAVSSRRLADRFIKKSETAYTLENCKDFCATETGFSCNGFAYRRPLSQGEILNCDLTDQDTKTLDQYNSYDFYESAVTDYYERDVMGRGDECRNGSNVAAAAAVSTITNDDGGECYVKVRASYKLYTYRDYKTVNSVQRCADECLRTNYCATFSYRYGQSGTADIGNCLLSDRRATELGDGDLVNTSATASDWDLFEVRTDGERCGSGYGEVGDGSSSSNNGGGTGERNDCYRRERVGYKHYFTTIRDTLTVESLRDCSDGCQSRSYCLTFSFRYGGSSAVSGRSSADNCLLSNLAVDQASSPDSVVADPSWDFYESRSESLACRNGGSSSSTSSSSSSSSNDCLKLDRKGFKFYTLASSIMLSANSLQECAEECQRAVTCKSFAYSRTVGYAASSDNCQLSLLPVESILSKDLISDRDWDIFEKLSSSTCQDSSATNQQNGECYRKYLAGSRHETNSYRESLNVRDREDCADECGRTDYCRSFSYQFLKYGTSMSGSNCLLSPDLVRDLSDSDKRRENNWNTYEFLEDVPNCKIVDTRRPPGAGNECMELVKKGNVHRSNAVVSTTDARGLSECAAACRRMTSCVSFSYRANGRYSSSHRNNCLLSNFHLAVREHVYKLDRDPDWDSYRMMSGVRCDNRIGSDVGLSSRISDCYRLFDTNYRLSSLAVRDSLSAPNLLSCEKACSKATYFDCRSFAFRRRRKRQRTSSSSSNNVVRNCDLSTLDPRDSNFQGSLVQDNETRIYERRSAAACEEEEGGGGGESGYGENSHPRESSSSGGGSATNDSSVVDNDTSCSENFKRQYRLKYQLVRDVIDAQDLRDCEAKCLKFVGFRCTGFSYRYRSTGTRNCEVTDRTLDEVDSRFDIDVAEDWDIYRRIRFNGECRGVDAFVGGGQERLPCYDRYRDDHSSLRSRAVVEQKTVTDAEECARICDSVRGRGGGCQTFAFRKYRNRSTPNCFLSDSRGRKIDDDIERNFDSEVYEYRGGSSSSGMVCGRSVAYSVSGKRCRNGSQLNADVRYWYCETEDEPGWDYCCRPESNCGHSEGFAYPWCYVGEAGYDQWRPCSEEAMKHVGDSSSDLVHASPPPGVAAAAPGNVPLNVTNTLTYHDVQNRRRHDGERGVARRRRQGRA